jgi:hypothetical protein
VFVKKGGRRATGKGPMVENEDMREENILEREKSNAVDIYTNQLKTKTNL